MTENEPTGGASRAPSAGEGARARRSPGDSPLRVSMTAIVESSEAGEMRPPMRESKGPPWSRPVHHSDGPEATRPVVRVAIAAEVRLYREGLEHILRRHSTIDVVGVLISEIDLVDRIQVLDPQVVVLDVGLPGAIGIAQRIRQQEPPVRIVAFAVSEDATDVLAWAAAGIHGYVCADASIDELIEAVHGAVEGHSSCPPRVTAKLLNDLAGVSLLIGEEPHRRAHLTARELEITSLLGDGLSNREIADRLSIALPTVKNHVHNILEKLNVPDRWRAAAAADLCFGPR